MQAADRAFILGLPKAELHLHIEGSLEPEMMFALARRNQVTLPYDSVEAIRAAYQFTDLQSFLIVLRRCRRTANRTGFYDLTCAYIDRAIADNVLHAEIFFDPQTHRTRHRDYHRLCRYRARLAKRDQQGFSSRMILCFLRHLSEDDAMSTLESALPLREDYADCGTASVWIPQNSAIRRKNSRTCSRLHRQWACSSPTPVKKARQPTSGARWMNWVRTD
jgi:adenosine deaminase